MISVLVVDDELPAVQELSYLLGRDSRVGPVHTATSGTEALRVLEREEVDAIFLDIHMPGLTGLDLARVIARFAAPPAVVFVTADEDHALEAFDLAAVDYLLKPVRPERLERCVARVAELREATGAPAGAEPAVITVEQGGVTRMIRRDDVTFVQAQGDYARLHTDGASYLVRVPLSDLERQWGPAGFVRIHRSYLVAMDAVRQLRLSAAQPTVVVGGGAELPVSRRLLPGLRERLAATRIRPLP
ncbi:LytR/AlgR family response regulator transcription factor [Sinomonas mesophila]|uniref:LytR/AlgR family response regulator transcription factor n=1 Tax=Sinomonas mesophila TaxID=1531955 RepID=UPI000984C664|nr:LytTR family DNA-binding domain-containing protein [Sinomonas mesophila]